MLDARLMHIRGLRVFHESEVASGIVLERMRLHKVTDAKQERLYEPAGQALGQPRQAEGVPCIRDHVVERGPGVSDHAVVKPVPIEETVPTGTLHQEGVEFFGGTQLDDGGPHRLSDDIVIIAPGLRLKLTAEDHVRHHRKRHLIANEIGYAYRPPNKLAPLGFRRHLVSLRLLAAYDGLRAAGKALTLLLRLRPVGPTVLAPILTAPLVQVLCHSLQRSSAVGFLGTFLHPVNCDSGTRLPTHYGIESHS